MRFRYPSGARCFCGYLSLSLSLISVPALAHAEWNTLSAESEPGNPVIEHRHVIVEDAAAGRRADLNVAVFSGKSFGLRIIDNPGGESLSATMKREKCVCGVNGGYFDPEFKPIGLRITDGRIFSPLRRARLITAILLQTDRGIDLIRAGEFSRMKNVDAGLQCGPFLVEAGKRIRGLSNSPVARRTFAATMANDRALVGVCSPISLMELANVLATAPIAADSKIRRAVNLDGGSSSAFWFAREDGSVFSIPGQKPVRDLVGIMAK